MDLVWGIVNIYIFKVEIRDLESMLKIFFLKLRLVFKNYRFFKKMFFMIGWKYKFEIGVWNSIKFYFLISCWEYMDIIFIYSVYFFWVNFLEIYKGFKVWLIVIW